MTDKPEDQVYLNGAGTMMDRNLGATSATPGDVGALGLLYQWGRGTSSNSKDTFTPAATSPAEWPAPVKSDENNGTIEYAVANPTLFITQNDKNEDWHFTGDKTMDDTRWKPSVKTIYDPCPPGYMVPVGDDKDGIWAKAFKSTGFIGKYDYSRNGYNFGASDLPEKASVGIPPPANMTQTGNLFLAMVSTGPAHQKVQEDSAWQR